MAEPNYIPAGPWNDEPELWDRIEIGGKLCPGLAKVEIDRANKFDDKKAKGKSGANREFSGVDPAKVSIEIRIWTKDDYEEFVREFLPIIEPNTEKEKIEPYAISHQVAIDRKVKEMTTDHVKGPTMVETHIYAFTIEGEEHRPPSPKNATGTMNGSKTKSAGIQGDCFALGQQRSQLQADQQGIQARIAQLEADSGDPAFFGQSQGELEMAQLRSRWAQNEDAIAAISDSMRNLSCENRPPGEPDLNPPEPQPNDPPPEEPFNQPFF